MVGTIRVAGMLAAAVLLHAAQAGATSLHYEFTVEGGYYGSFSWNPYAGTSFGVVTGAEPALMSAWVPDDPWTLTLFDAADALVFDGGDLYPELDIWADRSNCDVFGCYPHPTWRDSLTFTGGDIRLFFEDSSGTLLPDAWTLAPGDGPLPELIVDALDFSHFDVARMDGPVSGSFTSWTRVQPVPEPGAATMFALGALVVAAVTRRSARGTPRRTQR